MSAAARSGEGPPESDRDAHEEHEERDDATPNADDAVGLALESYLLARDAGERSLRASEFLSQRAPELGAEQHGEFLARLAAFELVERSLSQLEAPAPLATGNRLGRYRILGLLGRGGMGEVYRARDERLNRDVALKLIAPERARDPRMRRRFEREARSAGALSHPHLVTVFDLEEAEGRLFLAMEYVPGKTLRDLDPSEQPGLEDRVRFIAQVARAVAVAHRAGIVHRDLKPENLMLGEGGAPKVLDFGLAKPLEAEGLGATSQTGQILGTSWYMSPEQVRGRELTPASDQFALAIVLFEWLSGERPFGGESAYEIAEAIVKRPPQRLRIDAPWAEELERILMRAFEKEPERRYPDLEAMALDLERALDGRSARGGRAPRADRSTWQRAAAAAALVALLLLAAKVGLDALRPASADASRELPAIAVLPCTFAGAPAEADEWGAHVQAALVKELERTAGRTGWRVVAPEILDDLAQRSDRLEHAYHHGALVCIEPSYRRMGDELIVELGLIRLDGPSRDTAASESSEPHVVAGDAYSASGHATRQALTRLMNQARVLRTDR